MQRINDAFRIVWNYDEFGNRVIVPKSEIHVVINSKVTLFEIPSEVANLTVYCPTSPLEVFTEIDARETEKSLDQNEFRVHYGLGVIFLNSYWENRELTISYESKGVIMYHASRIFYKTNEQGEVLETLQDLLDTADVVVGSYEDLMDLIEQISVYEDYIYTKTYYPMNKVIYGGNTYLSLVEQTGVTPVDDDVNWKLIVASTTSQNASDIITDTDHRFVTDAEKLIWNDKYTQAEVDNALSQLVSNLYWKEAVATFSDLATTYPDAVEGWTASVNEDDMIYRHDGTSWIVISGGDIPLATHTVSGKMSFTDKIKIDGIEDGANNYIHPSSHDSTMINEDSTHRFATDAEKTAWNSKADGVHNHDTDYSSIVHSHTESQITDLQSYSLTTHDHDLTYPQISHSHVESDITDLQNYSVDGHSHALTDTTGLQDALNAKEEYTNKGVANGYASLDSSGIVPLAQLPSSLESVLEYTTLSNFPLTGENNILYIAQDTNIVYRWNVSVYTAIEIDGFSYNDLSDVPTEFTPISHTHTESDISDLQNYSLSTHNHDLTYSLNTHNHDLDYADITHTHTESEISDLQNYSLSTHNHDTDYSDILHNHDSDYSDILHNHDTDYADITHNHGISDVTDLQTTLNGKESTSNKGIADGYAGLDGSGKVPLSQLPASIEDVQVYTTLTNFPVTGEVGVLYIATDTNQLYRWDGADYTLVGGTASGLTLGETSDTAYRGDRGKIAYDHTFLTTNPHSVSSTDVGLGNVDNTSDLNKPISTATQTALNGKEDTLGFTPENIANKGQIDGYASLDSGGKLPSSQLTTHNHDSDYADITHSHIIGDTTGLQTALDGKQDNLGYTAENQANKGQLNGYASLDATGKLPSSEMTVHNHDSDYANVTHTHTESEISDLQSYSLTTHDHDLAYSALSHSHTESEITDLSHKVIEYADLASFPPSGESGIIYIAIDTNIAYRWASTVYDALNIDYFSYSNLSDIPSEFNPSSHSHSISETTGLQTAIDGKQDSLGFTPEDSANKGISNGYASLDVDSRLPSTQLTIHNHDTDYADLSHTHTESQITDLQSYSLSTHDHDLTYSALSHTHTESEITDLQSYALTTHNHDADYANIIHGHAISDITNLQTSLDGKEDSLGFTPENSSNKGQINGYASLDGSGKVPVAQLPSSSNSILEYTNLASFPATGDSNTLYLAQDTNIGYMWTGSVYDALNIDYFSYTNLSNIPSEFTPSSHSHTESDITDLQSYSLSTHNHDLDYADIIHSHTQSDITDLDTSLFMKKSADSGLDMNNNSISEILSATFKAMDGFGLNFYESTNFKVYVSTSTNGTYGGRLDSTSTYNMYFYVNESSSNRGFVFLNQNGVSAQIEGDGTFRNIGDLRTTGTIYQGGSSLSTIFESLTNKGVANGYASLGADGKVPSGQLPASSDEVQEYADYASLPVTGSVGVIYITLDTDLVYIWDGADYKGVGGSGLTLGETSDTAYRGDRGKTAYDHTLLTDNPHTVTATQVGLGNVNNTSDADKPISTATQTALNGKEDSLGFTPENTANKSIANGYASLDATGKLPSGELTTHTHTESDITDLGSYSLDTHNHDGTYATSSHAHAISDVTNLQTTLDGKEDETNKGIANGYASLGADGKVPASQLPDGSTSVTEYADFASFPATGTTGVLYIATDTDNAYRWTGSVYDGISVPNFSYNDLSDIPSTFTPATHSHTESDITDLQSYSLSTHNHDTAYLGITANASSASILQTSRTITLSGDVDGSVSFNGSQDVTITTTVDENTRDTLNVARCTVSATEPSSNVNAGDIWIDTSA